MSVVAVAAIFGTFCIGFSLRSELLPTVPLLLVIGTLAAIVMGHSLREKNQDNREDDGRSGSQGPFEG
jgi:hypothetical protein